MKNDEYLAEVKNIAQQLLDDYPGRGSYYEESEEMAKSYDTNDAIILYLKKLRITLPYNRLANDISDAVHQLLKERK